MKTCDGRYGPHQYSDELIRCPECRTANGKAWRLAKKAEREASKPKVPDGFKLCKNGLHLYSDQLRQCPECYEIAKLANNIRRKGPEQKAKRRAKYAEDHPKPECPPGFKWCRKMLHQHPEDRDRCPGCKAIQDKKYRESPKGIAATKRKKERNHQPERRAKKNASNSAYYHERGGAKVAKAYNATPKAKDTQKRYRQSDRGKAIAREFEQQPKTKARRKAWWQSPKGQAVSKVSTGKRTKIAANGDLTDEQWMARVAEFDHKCAYCQIQLLTKADGVSKHHPHYLNIDHIIPLLKDGQALGQHTLVNVVPCCHGHNNSKCNKDVFLWMAEQNITPTPQLLAILIKAMELHYPEPSDQQKFRQQAHQWIMRNEPKTKE